MRAGLLPGPAGTGEPHAENRGAPLRESCGRVHARIQAPVRDGDPREADRVFRSLRSLVYVESLRSEPTGGILTTWKMVAPDSLSYQIKDGAAAVVIGRRRWDQVRPGGAWEKGSQNPPLTVPEPSWGAVTTNAHVLGAATVHGRSTWIVTFANPTIPAWFTAWIDMRTSRTLQLRMTAAAHFMFHRYLAFDEPVRITPPAALEVAAQGLGLLVVLEQVEEDDDAEDRSRGARRDGNHDRQTRELARQGREHDAVGQHGKLRQPDGEGQ